MATTSSLSRDDLSALIGSDSGLLFWWRVQVVLGVVYNVSQDYDSAVEAFEKALQARPDDYSLWNKVRSPPIVQLRAIRCPIA